MTTAVAAHAENSSDLLSGKIEPQESRNDVSLINVAVINSVPVVSTELVLTG